MRKMTAKRRFLSEMKGRNSRYRSFIQEKLTLRVAAEMELGRERMRDEELTTDAESDFPVYKTATGENQRVGIQRFQKKIRTVSKKK